MASIGDGDLDCAVGSSTTSARVRTVDRSTSTASGSSRCSAVTTVASSTAVACPSSSTTKTMGRSHRVVSVGPIGSSSTGSRVGGIARSREPTTSSSGCRIRSRNTSTATARTTRGSDGPRSQTTGHRAVTASASSSAYRSSSNTSASRAHRSGSASATVAAVSVDNSVGLSRTRTDTRPTTDRSSVSRSGIGSHSRSAISSSADSHREVRTRVNGTVKSQFTSRASSTATAAEANSASSVTTPRATTATSAYRDDSNGLCARRTGPLSCAGCCEVEDLLRSSVLVLHAGCSRTDDSLGLSPTSEVSIDSPVDSAVDLECGRA